MCTHKHKIRNPYTHREMWVDCGKCDACKQKRANVRANQIRLHNNGLSKDYYPWFFHLTYLNECVPYVRRDDVRKYNEQRLKRAAHYISLHRHDGHTEHTHSNK